MGQKATHGGEKGRGPEWLRSSLFSMLFALGLLAASTGTVVAEGSGSDEAAPASRASAPTLFHPASRPPVAALDLADSLRPSLSELAARVARGDSILLE